MSAETHDTPNADSQPLLPWMRGLLRFVAVYNVLAGLTMLIGYHEMYKMIDIAKPDLVLPIQLVGMLVGLFGVGYWRVATRPVENRDLLLLGLLSKGLGSILGIFHVAQGTLPPVFLVALFFADIVYLVPFWIITRRLYRLAG
jgi:small multidrug resistance pump